jgi:hypothetical protein
MATGMDFPENQQFADFLSSVSSYHHHVFEQAGGGAHLTEIERLVIDSWRDQRGQIWLDVVFSDSCDHPLRQSAVENLVQKVGEICSTLVREFSRKVYVPDDIEDLYRSGAALKPGQQYRVYYELPVIYLITVNYLVDFLSFVTVHKDVKYNRVGETRNDFYDRWSNDDGSTDRERRNYFAMGMDFERLFYRFLDDIKAQKNRIIIELVENMEDRFHEDFRGLNLIADRSGERTLVKNWKRPVVTRVTSRKEDPSKWVSQVIEDIDKSVKRALESVHRQFRYEANATGYFKWTHMNARDHASNRLKTNCITSAYFELFVYQDLGLRTKDMYVGLETPLDRPHSRWLETQRWLGANCSHWTSKYKELVTRSFSDYKRGPYYRLSSQVREIAISCFWTIYDDAVAYFNLNVDKAPLIAYREPSRDDLRGGRDQRPSYQRGMSRENRQRIIDDFRSNMDLLKNRIADLVRDIDRSISYSTPHHRQEGLLYEGTDREEFARRAGLRSR